MVEYSAVLTFYRVEESTYMQTSKVVMATGCITMGVQ